MSTTATAPRSDADQVSTTDVLIIVPPFQGVRCPALGASQLKGNLLQAGISAQLLYLNMRFADRISPRLGDWISATGPALFGEFIYSYVLHDMGEKELDRYLDDCVHGSFREGELKQFFPQKTPREALIWLIDEARDFVTNDAIDQIVARDPKIVGFSSTFQANCSSLLMMRELKKRKPDVVTVMGGANCETIMGEELMRRYPFLDHVGRGECDQTFVEFVNTVLAGKPVVGLTGFLSREDEKPTIPSPPLHAAELDANAYPDFDDYFGQLNNFRYSNLLYPGLSIETSRGCWWGAKSHCTFCAFNREGMVFRSKTPARAVEEINHQIERYGVPRLEMTDNILDMDYFKNVLHNLAQAKSAEYFWETKSNLSREQIRMLRKAGVTWIQPGIESLSDLTLKLMRKGATQLQQIQILKYCTESGIKITWNWLFGFPGEDENELPALKRAVKAIHHLQPPGASPVLYLERYSPYHENPGEWGLEPIRPGKGYYHVYPFEEEAVRNLAFFWESPFLSGKEGGNAHNQLNDLVAEWGAAYGQSHFIMVPRKSCTMLIDTRPCAKKFIRRLTGLERRVFDYCWKIRGERDIQKTFADEASPEEISKILRQFVEDYILLDAPNGRYLNLATDARLEYKQFPARFPGGGIAPTPRKPRPLVQRIADVAIMRIPPSRVTGAIGRRWQAWRRRTSNRIVVRLARALSLPLGEDVSPTTPTATPVQRPSEALSA